MFRNKGPTQMYMVPWWLWQSLSLPISTIAGRGQDGAKLHQGRGTASSGITSSSRSPKEQDKKETAEDYGRMDELEILWQHGRSY